MRCAESFCRDCRRCCCCCRCAQASLIVLLGETSLVAQGTGIGVSLEPEFSARRSSYQLTYPACPSTLSKPKNPWPSTLSKPKTSCPSALSKPKNPWPSTLSKPKTSRPSALSKPKNPCPSKIGQLVGTARTEKPGATLMVVRVPSAARDFSPRVSVQSKALLQ